MGNYLLYFSIGFGLGVLFAGVCVIRRAIAVSLDDSLTG